MATKATNRETAAEQIDVLEAPEDGSDTGAKVFGVPIVGRCDVKELRRAFERFLDDRDRR